LLEDDPTLGKVLEDVLNEAHLDIVRCRTLSDVHAAVRTGEIDVALADAWGTGPPTQGRATDRVSANWSR
jgi:DNA-binding response OmpR family regulator